MSNVFEHWFSMLGVTTSRIVLQGCLLGLVWGVGAPMNLSRTRIFLDWKAFLASVRYDLQRVKGHAYIYRAYKLFSIQKHEHSSTNTHVDVCLHLCIPAVTKHMHTDTHTHIHVHMHTHVYSITCKQLERVCVWAMCRCKYAYA